MKLYISKDQNLAVRLSTQPPIRYAKDVKTYDIINVPEFTMVLGGLGSINSTTQGSFRILELQGNPSEGMFKVAGFICGKYIQVDKLSNSQLKEYEAGVSLSKEYRKLFKSPYEEELQKLRIKLKGIKTKATTDQYNNLIQQESTSSKLFYCLQEENRNLKLEELLAVI
jgi:hypothetical protein